MLGKGGMGEVWKARDTALGRVVAVKLLQGGEPEDLARFKREGRIVAGLSHPHVAQLYEVGDDPPHIALQYIAGAPLDRVSLPIEAKVAALAQAARGVHHAHAHGVLHRDLKPANIMIDAEGRGIVLDFGLAREFRADTTALSMSGDIMGTPTYMAPEQARGRIHDLDARTDVYGLGATLYALIAGRSPHAGANALEVVFSAINDDPPRPGGDRDLETICLKAIDRDPARRYQTAEALADDLERWGRNEPIQARPPSTWYRLKKRIQRQPLVWALLALLIVGVAAGATYVAAKARREARLARARKAVDDVRAQLEGFAARLYLPGATLAPILPKLRAMRGELAGALAEWPDFAPAHYWTGRTYMVEGRFASAIDSFEAALRADPTSGYMWADLGRAKIERALERHRCGGALRDTLDRMFEREAAEAIGCYDRAGEVFAGGIERDVATAYRLRAQGRKAEIRELLDRAKKAYGSTPGIEELEFLTASNLPEREAIEHLTAAIRIRPGYYVAFQIRAVFRMLIKDRQGALEDADESIRIHPECATAYFSRGFIRYLDRNFDDAIRDYSEAVRLDPALAVAVANRGTVHVELRDWDAALADFSEAIRVDPTYVLAHVNRAVVRMNRKEYDAVVADCDAAIRLAPTYARAHFIRGNALMALRRFPQAVAAYDEAIKQEPKFPSAYQNRGFAKRDAGDVDGAVKDLETFLSMAPNDPHAPAVQTEIQRLRSNDF